MPDITEIITQFRTGLLRRDRRATSEIVRAYGTVWRDLRSAVEYLGQQIEQARERGETVSLDWLFQFERLQSLQRQVEARVAAVVDLLDATVTAEQAEVVAAARRHAEQLIRTSLGRPPVPNVSVSFAQLPTYALQDLVGALQDGSPLRELLDALGETASREVQRRLIAGVATGLNPVDVARQVREALANNLARALTIARTEILRSYRTASLRTYQANADLVKGWVWRSAADRRTCAFCWARHGSVHPLNEPFATHPRCRCSPAPVTRSWRELGFATVQSTETPEPTGPELFAKLPETTQRAVLGPAKFEAYKSGRIALEDLVGVRRDPRWGPVGYERSLLDAMWAAEQRKSGERERRQEEERRRQEEQKRQEEQRQQEEQRRRQEKQRRTTRQRSQKTPEQRPPLRLPADPVRRRYTLLAAQLRDHLEDVLGLKSTWNGVVDVEQNVAYNGIKYYGCSIGLRDTIAGNSTRGFLTLVHEMVHSVSPGLNPTTYPRYVGWEEGVVESTARIVTKEITSRTGTQLDQNTVFIARLRSGYNGYIRQLDRAREALGMSEYDFYTTLIKLPLEQRPEWVRQRLGTRNAALFEEINDALTKPIS